MPRVHIAALLAAALGGCGSSNASDSDTTFPEPITVAPEATTGHDEEAAEQPGEPPGDARVPAEPPDETNDGDAEAGVFMRLFGSGGSQAFASSMGTPARWWILVRDPGGAEQRYRTDASQPASLTAPHVFPGEVAGWRCQLQRAAVQQNVQITGGTRTTTHRAERTLVCEKDGQQRTATAVCGFDEDPSGRTPVVTPAELDVGDPQDPHQVTLSCDPP